MGGFVRPTKLLVARAPELHVVKEFVVAMLKLKVKSNANILVYYAF